MFLHHVSAYKITFSFLSNLHKHSCMNSIMSMKCMMCFWTQMPPAATKSKLAILSHVHSHKVIDPLVIWKCFTSWVCMQNIKSLSLTAQKLWPRLKFLPNTDMTETRCPRITFMRHRKNFSNYQVIFFMKLWESVSNQLNSVVTKYDRMKVSHVNVDWWNTWHLLAKGWTNTVSIKLI